MRSEAAQMSESPVVSEIISQIEADIDKELGSSPDVKDVEPDNLDISKLPLGKREWFRLDDVVAVVVDLKGSTHLGTGKNAASTASIYEAATDNAVKVLHDFDAGFIQIQGDGAFGLFWGEGRYERAVCAGITIKTFSKYLVEKIDGRWPDAPDTGFKVGIASGRVLVKQIGTPRNPNEQEPVWAGKPVNYAAKAAQTADVDQLIVSGAVWDEIESNDYLTVTCACNPQPSLWENVEIKNVPDDDDDRFGQLLEAAWCDTCGDEFCQAILEGKTDRDDAEGIAQKVMAKARAGVLSAVIERRRSHRIAHRRGLAK